jgi:hypothetical protein
MSMAASACVSPRRARKNHFSATLASSASVVAGPQPSSAAGTPRARRIVVAAHGVLAAAAEDALHRGLAPALFCHARDRLAHQLGQHGALVLPGESLVEGLLDVLGHAEIDGGHDRDPVLKRSTTPADSCMVGSWRRLSCPCRDASAVCEPSRDTS